jgi:hypothetical protein
MNQACEIAKGFKFLGDRCEQFDGSIVGAKTPQGNRMCCKTATCGGATYCGTAAACASKNATIKRDCCDADIQIHTVTCGEVSLDPDNPTRSIPKKAPCVLKKPNGVSIKKRITFMASFDRVLTTRQTTKLANTYCAHVAIKLSRAVGELVCTASEVTSRRRLLASIQYSLDASLTTGEDIDTTVASDISSTTGSAQLAFDVTSLIVAAIGLTPVVEPSYTVVEAAAQATPGCIQACYDTCVGGLTNSTLQCSCAIGCERAPCSNAERDVLHKYLDVECQPLLLPLLKWKVVCPEGSATPNNTNGCEICAAGTFTNDAYAVGCTSCGSGEYSLANSSRCTPCNSSLYASPNQGVCSTIPSQPGFVSLGKGECNTGLYSKALVRSSAVLTLDACAATCAKEDKCRFFSFKESFLCKRYSGSAAATTCYKVKSA